MSQRTGIFIAVISVAVVALAGAAFATPPTGFTTNVLARGSAGQLHTKHVASASGAATVSRPTLRWPPSRSTRAGRPDGITIPVSSWSSFSPGL
jgi:hypothetical protein